MQPGSPILIKFLLTTELVCYRWEIFGSNIVLSSTEIYVTLSYRYWHSCKGTPKSAVRPPDLKVDQSTQGKWGQDEDKRLTFCASYICALCTKHYPKHSACIISSSSYFKDKETEAQWGQKTCIINVGSDIYLVTSQVHSEIQFWPRLEAF